MVNVEYRLTMDRLFHHVTLVCPSTHNSMSFVIPFRKMSTRQADDMIARRMLVITAHRMGESA